jgi:hypothetical protein
MAITITPMPSGQRLKIDGDVQTILEIPANPPEWSKDGTLVDSYYISCSDGTLIQASYAQDPEFDVVIEGAARVTVAASGRELWIDWNIDWVNVAARCGAMGMARRQPAPLPLLDLLNVAA